MKMSFNYTHATAVKANGSGKWHPAITNREEIYYWPNRTYNTQEDALNAAKATLGDALSMAQSVCNSWNIVPSHTGLEV